MTDVLVVSAIRVHRESLAMALNAQSVSVLGTAATVAEALPRFRDLGAEVAVLDARSPEDVNLASPASAEPEMKLLAVGVREDEAVDWLEAGVSGYVSPEASLERLAGAVASVARGEIVTSPEVTTHLLRRVRRLAAEVPEATEEGRLTRREAEVLGLIAEGLSNKVIAKRLSIQEQTVKNHVHNILIKLGVHRRAEAAARMRRRRRRSPDR
jgi:two-component system nitrate/nitrite response regulator NarL